MSPTQASVCYLNDPFLSDFCEPQKYNLNLGEESLLRPFLLLMEMRVLGIYIWGDSRGRDIVFGAKQVLNSASYH